ncbi:hypothetical protein QTN25_003089 [Entamoeba marina]
MYNVEIGTINIFNKEMVTVIFLCFGDSYVVKASNPLIVSILNVNQTKECDLAVNANIVVRKLNYTFLQEQYQQIFNKSEEISNEEIEIEEGITTKIQTLYENVSHSKETEYIEELIKILQTNPLKEQVVVRSALCSSCIFWYRLKTSTQHALGITTVTDFCDYYYIPKTLCKVTVQTTHSLSSKYFNNEREEEQLYCEKYCQRRQYKN